LAGEALNPVSTQNEGPFAFIEDDERNVELARLLLEQQESDRGVTIFAATLLEDDLESLLRVCCLNDPVSVKKVVDPLFNVYAPFSTLSAKIQVTYALGLIPKNLYRTLTLIRKMRNDFAHDRKVASFQSPKYKSQLHAIFESSQPEYSAAEAAKRMTVDSDDEKALPQMGKTTKREFIDRLAFCFCVVRTSARIAVAQEVRLLAQKKMWDITRLAQAGQSEGRD
jgi:DNA-binding MltR family transcriptional regulator